jgi:hypothetical protein
MHSGVISVQEECGQIRYLFLNAFALCLRRRRRFHQRQLRNLNFHPTHILSQMISHQVLDFVDVARGFLSKLR